VLPVVPNWSKVDLCLHSNGECPVPSRRVRWTSDRKWLTLCPHNVFRTGQSLLFYSGNADETANEYSRPHAVGGQWRLCGTRISIAQLFDFSSHFDTSNISVGSNYFLNHGEQWIVAFKLVLSEQLFL